MNINKKYDIFRNWIQKKYNSNIIISSNGKHGKHGIIKEEYLRLFVSNFPKWKELLKKYTENELMDYFIQVVREELPELKRTKLYFTNENPITFYKPGMSDTLPHRTI